MTREHVVNRARSAIGHGCLYRLGQGGMKPHRTVPWDEEHECDCSGFAMWALGVSRFQDPLWYDSTRIFNEARAGSAWFTEVPWDKAQPGDLLVYPDRTGTDGVRRHGHVSVVTEASSGPILIADCSATNFSRYSDAIREGPLDAFVSRGVVARYARLENA